MSDKDTSEDLERTIRLNPKKVMDPYDDPTPPSVDSIEDLFNGDDFADISDVSFEQPEETTVSALETIDFDHLTKEMNELSHEFDLNALEEGVKVAVKEDKPIEKKASSTTAEETPPKVKEESQVSVKEDKPVEKKTPEKTSSTKETSPEISAVKNKQDKISKPDTDLTDKKEVKKAKGPAPIVATKKSSNGITTAMLFISLIALAAGFAGAWTSMSSQSQIDALSTQLNTAQNNALDNQAELITMQAELSSLKQALASLKPNHETPTLIKSEPAKVVQPAKKISPATITPITPIKEVKPTLLKNTWNVIISSHNSIKKAKTEQQRESIKGMNTSIVAVVVNGKNWYRIVATGFTDKQQAVNFAKKLKQQGISDAWIQYNK